MNSVGISSVYIISSSYSCTIRSKYRFIIFIITNYNITNSFFQIIYIFRHT